MKFLLPYLLLAACASVSTPPELLATELDSVPRVHRSGDVYLAGQPSSGGLAQMKEAGIAQVINLRGPDEDLGCDEPGIVEALGMEYLSLPIDSPEALTDDLFGQLRASLREADGPVLVHCKSANRVGAVWLTYRVLDQGVDLEQALEEAHQVGLRSATLEAKALEYISRERD